MRVALIVGTRPEIIKMSPVVKELERRGIEHLLVHTGQHYDYLMDGVFFKDLGLKEPTVNLKVGSGSQVSTIAKIMEALEKYFTTEKPDVVLVQGDTNSALAGALVSAKMHLKSGHVEAGLRSYDRRLPEEYNRIICDHISDYLFAPTDLARQNLLDEGISKREMLYYGKRFTPKIVVTGNTIVDAVMDNLQKAEKTKVLANLGITTRKYFMVTAHREENVDYKENLKGIITALRSITKQYRLPMIFPLHPRTRSRLTSFSLMDEVRSIKGLKIVEPLGFFELLALEGNAKVVLTDSGGIQEETCILRTPCVVMRERTERPEAIAVGGAVLAGCDPKRILKATKVMFNKKRNWKNPFGDGKAATRIINTICGRE